MKRLEQDEKFAWKRKVVREQRVLYKVKEDRGVEVLITHQGMWLRCFNLLISLGHEPVFEDLRIPLPDPRLDLMQGFRFSQQPLLTQALLMKCSGCVKAPTRYGKTTLMKNTLRAFSGLCSVVTVPGTDLLEQTFADLKEAMPHRHIVQFGGGSRHKIMSDDITVCSMDSLDKCDHGRVQLLLIDEPHSAITDSRIPEILKFTKARKLGFGATLEGRYDQRDIVLEAIIGPTLIERTYQQAVAEGAICEIVVIMLKMPVPVERLDENMQRNRAYREIVWENPHVIGVIQELSRFVIPPNIQTLIFIDNEKQADALHHKLPEAPVAMAMRMKKKDRTAMAEQMRDGHIQRCIASEIYSTGVTFHELQIVINAAGGGGSISCIQKPGRLAEVRPGKKCGVFIDFIFEGPDKKKESNEDFVLQGEDAIEALSVKKEARKPWNPIVGDCWSRYGVYAKKGYTMHIVESVAEVQEILMTKCF